jgi:hypothetical protein
MTNCAICGCRLNHEAGVYGEDTPIGRSHATEHHLIAKRFFGPTNINGKHRTQILEDCPWPEYEKKTTVLCYDCHEELLHNIVFLTEDIEGFKELVERRKLNEVDKSSSKKELAGRIELLHKVLELGIEKQLEIEEHR